MGPKKQFLALVQAFRASMLIFFNVMTWRKNYIKSDPKTRKTTIFHQFLVPFTSKFRPISKFILTPQFEKGTTSSEENENINFRRIPPP